MPSGLLILSGSTLIEKISNNLLFFILQNNHLPLILPPFTKNHNKNRLFLKLTQSPNPTTNLWRAICMKSKESRRNNWNIPEKNWSNIITSTKSLIGQIAKPFHSIKPIKQFFPTAPKQQSIHVSKNKSVIRLPNGRVQKTSTNSSVKSDKV